MKIGLETTRRRGILARIRPWSGPDTPTTGDGPLEFENLLDPAVELYDPSGQMAVPRRR